MFTYMQEHENTEERLYEVWDSKVDLLDYYKSFLEGLVLHKFNIFRMLRVMIFFSQTSVNIMDWILHI